MPNWNYNSVEIHAPQEAVMAWLIPQPSTRDATLTDHYLLNMHKLFPETIPADDPI